jgi:uncharacterized protein YecE (DUF72 family)
MKKVYAGTSGWAYSSWKPDFYPPKLSSKKFLNYYSNRLNSVEVNYTFRSVPTEKLLVGWAAEAPRDFKFAVKANQTITHIKRLRSVTKATSEFIDSLLPMKKAGKLGPVLFQLPPNLKCDLSLLTDFLAGLPRAVRSTVEFRHASWFQDGVFAALRKANVALCLAESEKLETPDVHTADFFYLRMRKEEYSAKALEAIKQRVLNLAQKGEVFVYFKHEDTPEGALHAEGLLQTMNTQ